MQKRLGGAGGQEDENDDPVAAAAAGGSKHSALEKYSGVKVKVRVGGQLRRPMAGMRVTGGGMQQSRTPSGQQPVFVAGLPEKIGLSHHS